MDKRRTRRHSPMTIMRTRPYDRMRRYSIRDTRTSHDVPGVAIIAGVIGAAMSDRDQHRADVSGVQLFHETPTTSVRDLDGLILTSM